MSSTTLDLCRAIASASRCHGQPTCASTIGIRGWRAAIASSRIARAEPARAGVREHDQAELGGRVEEGLPALLRRVEALQRRMQLEPAQPELGETRQALNRIRSRGVHRAEADEAA